MDPPGRGIPLAHGRLEVLEVIRMEDRRRDSRSGGPGAKESDKWL